MEVKNGTFNISAGDDGMHADTSLAVSRGKITITKCYEGIESADITISGGTIDLTASYSWTPEKEYANIVISSSLIKSDQTYKEDLIR